MFELNVLLQCNTPYIIEPLQAYCEIYANARIQNAQHTHSSTFNL